MNKETKVSHEGFIPLFRRFLNNELWIEKRKFSKAEAWIDLLFMARYGEEPEEIIDRGELIKIDYGEILTSVKSLAEKWGRSETWVRALLEHLESKSSIKKHTKKNRRTIIGVVKLGHFQELVKKRSTERLTEEAQKKHRKSHKNKDNKDNKDKKGIPETKKSRCPLEEKSLGKHSQCLTLIKEISKERETYFPNFAKQINAVHKCLRAGFSLGAIEQCAADMLDNSFWKNRGWDLMDLANEIGKKGGKYKHVY